MPALAALLVAGCLTIQPAVDQVIDGLPFAPPPKIAAPLYLAVAAGDLICTIAAHNPKNILELISHFASAGIALHKLGVKLVRIEGIAEVRNPIRGSNKWITG